MFVKFVSCLVCMANRRKITINIIIILLSNRVYKQYSGVNIELSWNKYEENKTVFFYFCFPKNIERKLRKP